MNLSDYERWALRQRLGGATPPPDGPLSPAIKLLLSLDRQLLSDKLLETMPSELSAIIKIPLNATAPLPKQDNPCPELPAYARVNRDGRNAGAFYWQATKWAYSRSPMTPRNMIDSGVVWLIGLIVAGRCRLVLHESIYPNLYVLWVAETSKYAKTTGMRAIQKMIQAAKLNHHLLPGDVTKEGLFELLAGQTPTNFDKLPQRDKDLIQDGLKIASKRGFLRDEYSSILEAGRKDYMSGFKETLLELYDAPPIRQSYTRSGGVVTLVNACLNIFGATTPAAMARAIQDEDWTNGDMARYLIMFRDQARPYDDSFSSDVVPDEITQAITRLNEWLPQPKISESGNYEFDPKSAMMTPDALEAYKNYSRAVRYDLQDSIPPELQGNYNRLHIVALKVALSVAIMDAAQQNLAGAIVTLDHWAIGQSMAEIGRDSVHRLLPVLRMSTDSRNQNAILQALKTGRKSKSDLLKATNIPAKHLNELLTVLIEAGQVIQSQEATSGRMATVYGLSE